MTFYTPCPLFLPHFIHRHRRGVTLLEVVIAMFIFAIVGAGLITGSMQLRRMAESNVYESNAHSVASGFLEQLFAIDYPVISNMDDPVLLIAGIYSEDLDELIYLEKDNVFFNFAIRDGGSLSIRINDPLVFNNTTPNLANRVRPDFIFREQDRMQIPVSIIDGEEISMDFWFYPGIHPTPDGMRSTAITIVYGWRDIWTGQIRSRQINYIRSAGSM